MNKAPLTAHVYDAQEFIDQEWYLWDFGVFTCFGTEDYPLKVMGGHRVWQAWAHEVDVESVQSGEPVKTVEVTVYEFDYGVYVQTLLEEATHFLSDGSLYAISEGATRVENGVEGEEHLLLEEVLGLGRRGNAKMVPSSEISDRIADGDLMPMAPLSQ